MRVALAVFLAVLALVAPALAAPPEPQPAVTLRLLHPRPDGPIARHGSWTWLAVELENTGAAPVEGALRAFRGRGVRAGERSRIVFERRVSIAARSRRVERILWFCREIRSDAVVGFFREGDAQRPLASERCEVRVRDDVFHVLVVSRDDAAFGLFRDAAVGGLRRREGVATALSLADLPERAEAFESVDGLLLADVDLRALTPAQGEALEGFVEAGGQLVCCFGGNLGEYRETPLEGLLPVAIPERTEALPLPALAAFAGADRSAFAAPALVAVARPLAGSAVLVREGAVPLVVRRRAGKGVVTFLALDPTRRPLRGSSAGPGLVSRLFGAADAPADSRRTEGRGDPIAARLASFARTIESVRPPPFPLIGGLLALYILLVVPVNYGFWRRRGRAENAAPTAALLGILMGALVYALGTAYKGSGGLMNEVVLLEGAQLDARGAATAFCGLYSSERRLARVESRLLAAPSAPPPEQPETLSEARAATVRLDPPGAGPAGARRAAIDPVELDQWALRAITAKGPADTPVVRTDLALDQGSISGTIEAPPDAALSGALLLVGHRVAAIGDVAAGTSRSFAALPTTALRKGDAALALGQRLALGREDILALLARRPLLPAGDRELEGVILAAIPPEREPILFPDFAPPRRGAVRILATAVPVRIEAGPLEIARGLVRPRVTAERKGRVTSELGMVQQLLLGQTAAPGEPVFRLERGGIDLEFTLPVRDGFVPEAVSVDLRLVQESPTLEVAAVRPDLGEERIALDGTVVRILKPERFYDPRTGTMTLSLELPEGVEAVFLEPEIEVRGTLAPR